MCAKRMPLNACLDARNACVKACPNRQVPNRRFWTFLNNKYAALIPPNRIASSSSILEKATKVRHEYGQVKGMPLSACNKAGEDACWIESWIASWKASWNWKRTSVDIPQCVKAVSADYKRSNLQSADRHYQLITWLTVLSRTPLNSTAKLFHEFQGLACSNLMNTYWTILK
jgi:hypothetical protein